jgi:hypothetical protein
LRNTCKALTSLPALPKERLLLKADAPEKAFLIGEQTKPAGQPRTVEGAFFNESRYAVVEALGARSAAKAVGDTVPPPDENETVGVGVAGGTMTGVVVGTPGTDHCKVVVETMPPVEVPTEFTA